MVLTYFFFGYTQSIHDYSKVGPLPPFSNLFGLDASLVESSWEVLPAFLSCCMNLDSLVIVSFIYLSIFHVVTLRFISQENLSKVLCY